MVKLNSNMSAINILPNEFNYLLNCFLNMGNMDCTYMSDVASEFILSCVINVEESKTHNLIIMS
jgi:hypothetical protein